MLHTTKLLDPNNPDTYINRGFAYHQEKKYEEAILEYNKALEIDPNCAGAFCNRGSSYHRLEQYDKAISDYTQALARTPHDAELYYNRGLTYQKQQNYAAAICDYDRALVLNPNHVTALNNRGIIYYEQKNDTAAILDLAQAFALDPSKNNVRGVMRILLGENSKESILQAIMKRPQKEAIRLLAQALDKETPLGERFNTVDPTETEESKLGKVKSFYQRLVTSLATQQKIWEKREARIADQIKAQAFSRQIPDPFSFFRQQLPNSYNMFSQLPEPVRDRIAEQAIKLVSPQDLAEVTGIILGKSQL